jgi:transcriptional regulator with XRE-family HTH domain
VADNPFKRLRELSRTTQKDFATKYDLSKTVLIGIEQGLYPDLSYYQIQSLDSECHEKHINAKATLSLEYGTPDIQTAYHNWQSIERMQIASQIHSVSPQRGTILPPMSPIDFLIKDVTHGSVRGFGKLLKVPVASINRYSSGNTRTMPASLKKALQEVQYQYLPELEELQEEWINR